jgi:hypothetical protein
MALVGSHLACAQAMFDAERAVLFAYRDMFTARNAGASSAELLQMQVDQKAAALAVLFAHIAAQTTVTGTATGALGGGPGVPVVGTVG